MGRVLHQVAAEPTITLMKSRRRIALPKAGTTPTRTRLQQGFATGEMGFRGHCKAAILNRSCPLWVKSGYDGANLRCPLSPPKQTSTPLRPFLLLSLFEPYPWASAILVNELDAADF
jgi:hypothetical protein